MSSTSARSLRTASIRNMFSRRVKLQPDRWYKVQTAGRPVVEFASSLSVRFHRTELFAPTPAALSIARAIIRAIHLRAHRNVTLSGTSWKLNLITMSCGRALRFGTSSTPGHIISGFQRTVREGNLILAKERDREVRATEISVLLISRCTHNFTPIRIYLCVYAPLRSIDRPGLSTSACPSNFLTRVRAYHHLLVLSRPTLSRKQDLRPSQLRVTLILIPRRH